MNTYNSLINNLEELKLTRFKENIDTYLNLIADGTKTALDALYELTEMEKGFVRMDLYIGTKPFYGNVYGVVLFAQQITYGVGISDRVVDAQPFDQQCLVVQDIDVIGSFLLIGWIYAAQSLENRMVGVDFQNACGFVIVWFRHGVQHPFHFDGDRSFAGQADWMTLQAGGKLYFFHFACQCFCAEVQQCFIVL